MLYTMASRRCSHSRALSRGDRTGEREREEGERDRGGEREEAFFRDFFFAGGINWASLYSEV